MHVLSELRNPLFDTPDRQRALRALQMSRLLRENNGAKAWQAVRNMIDRAIEEHNASPRNKSQSSSSYASPPGQTRNNVPLDDPSNDNVRVYPAMGAIPSYAIQVSSGMYTPDPITTNPQQVQPDPDLLPPMLPQQQQQQPQRMRSQEQQQPQQDFMQNLVQPNWDDFNLSNINNIVGDMQQAPGIMPDFDFVSIIPPTMQSRTNKSRAFGVIRSITRMSLLPFQSRKAIFRRGQDEAHKLHDEH